MKRCLLLTALVAQAAFGADLYVATNGVDDDASGRGSEATPYKTLEYAYSKAAYAGDRILLKTGTYTLETADQTFVTLEKGVTVVSATGNPADVKIKKAKGCVLKLTHADAVLSSVTLADTPVGGGGYGSSGNILSCSAGTVTNCVIRDIKYGHAEYWWPVPISLSGTGLFTDCFFTNNTANSVGAWSVIAMSGGTMRRCLVADNVPANSTWDCDGVSLRASGGVAEDCVFTRNRAYSYPGVKATGSAKIKNCLIWNNWAAGDLTDDPRDVYSGSAPACFENCTARIAINGTCTATTDPGRYAPQMKVVAGLNFTASDTRFIVPKKVTFTATNGSAPYKWDFDGDGNVDRETQTNETTYEYTTPGRYTPKLTCGASTCDRPGLIEAMGTKMYVKKNSMNPTFPYADETTAATGPNAALLACVDGQEIVLAGQTFDVNDPVLVGRAVTFRGAGPDVTVLNPKTSGNRALQVRHPSARVTALTTKCCGGQLHGSELYLVEGVVSNCVFRGGQQGAGGYGKSHVYCDGEKAILTHSWITNNCSTFTGSTAANGVWLANGARCANSFIGYNIDKSASASVSACVRLYSSSILENCTVVGNKAQVTGGVYADGGVATNCVIVANTAAKNGAGYNDVYPGYAANYDHCVTEEVDLGGTNDQDAPANLFASYATKDFVPAAGSKLADKGVETAWTAAKDLAGTNRVMGAAIDIGCYERPAAAFEASFTTDVLEGFAPLEVTFTADAKGAGSGDAVWYYWDFDGDDIYEVKTNETTLVKMLVAGKPTVSLIASNATSGVVSEAFVKPAAVNVVPKVLHVVKDNPNAEFPYDCEENAAKDIPTAYEVAIDGCTILLHPTEHPLKQMITLSKAVTIRGTTGNPADVAVKYDGSRYDGFKFLFALDNANALVTDLTLTRGQYDVARAYVGDEPMGGTVSNCIIRGYSTASAWALAPVWLTSAKSLITHCLLTNNMALTSGPDASLEDASCGGIRLFGGARAENCLVANCTATNQASGVGGILAHNGKVVNCTVVNCRGRYVGGIANTSNGSVTNCVAACCATTGNAANSNVPADAALRVKFSHCATDTVVADGWVCATTDELFRNFAAGDYRPRKHGSPLYKAGADVPAIAAGTDLLGNPRGVDEKLDIGCYKVYNRGLMLLVR